MLIQVKPSQPTRRSSIDFWKPDRQDRLGRECPEQPRRRCVEPARDDSTVVRSGWAVGLAGLAPCADADDADDGVFDLQGYRAQRVAVCDEDPHSDRTGVLNTKSYFHIEGCSFKLRSLLCLNSCYLNARRVLGFISVCFNTQRSFTLSAITADLGLVDPVLCVDRARLIEAASELSDEPRLFRQLRGCGLQLSSAIHGCRVLGIRRPCRISSY